MGKVRETRGNTDYTGPCRPLDSPHLREMETCHKVLAQRVNDPSNVLKGSSRVPSEELPAEDKQGGREANQEPSGVTQGRALGAGPGGAGSVGRGRALGKSRVNTQVRRWASGDPSQGDRRGRGRAGPGSAVGGLGGGVGSMRGLGVPHPESRSQAHIPPATACASLGLSSLLRGEGCP